MRKLKWFLVLALVLAVVAPAGAVVLTFDELSFQPVNGLSYQGVTFGFTVGGSASTDANYNGTGPGTTTYVQDPSLEGNATGVLTFNFLVPTADLKFGVALDTYDPYSPALYVDLYNSSLSFLQRISVDTTPLVTYTEALFSYVGTPVGRAVLSGAGVPVTRFALDNLTYNTAPAPIPGAILLLGSGLSCLAIYRRRKMNAKN